VFVNHLGIPLLSFLIATPLIGALVVFLTPRGAVTLQRLIAWLVSAINFGLAVFAYINLKPTGGYQLVDQIDWLPDMGLKYAVGVDGINIWMVVLATVLTPLALWVARHREGDNQRAFYALILMLAGTLIGAFVATDLLLFYVFFELTLVPTALLIAIYGSGEHKAAALKYFVYPFIGSVFMLAGIAGLVVTHWQATGLMTFDSVIIAGAVANGTLEMGEMLERVLFAGFFLAFAIKTPIWPFHTWMPQAQAATPDDGSVDIAGILLKIGNAADWAAPAIGMLAIIGIIYSGIIAFGQHDLKLVLSYATISHLGFVMLGIFSQNVEGISGALVTMINSGITTGALFMIVGILAKQAGTRNRESFSGVWATAPRFGTVALFVVLASIGVPGLNGFIGEFLALQGTWLAWQLGYYFAAIAVIGVIISAAYLLRMYRGVFMGAAPEKGGIVEPHRADMVVLAVLAVVMLVIGLYPQLILAPMQPSISELVNSVQP
jgi:NADH-quinone oxidoreductase subunit M